jgi:peptidoglycan/xylan/chitin deacetylase (PgdA/CDA1 family)
VRGSIPILMYHDVTPTPEPEFRKYSLTPAEFDAQMRLLSDRGWIPVSLDRVLASRNDRAVLPARAIVITFDDGFQDCFTHAVPVLLEHAFLATFFFVSGLIGKTSAWLLPLRGIEPPIMSWSDIQELARLGFECGSHTMTHPHLPTLPENECRRELADSRKLLEDRLGRRIVHLAYPFGSYNEAVCHIAEREGYLSGCSTRTGVSDAGDDPFALHRVPVIGGETLVEFEASLLERRDPYTSVRGKLHHALAVIRSMAGAR